MRGLYVILCLLCTSCSMDPVPSFGYPRADIPRRDLNSIGVVSAPRIVQDNSGIVVLVASLPVSSLEQPKFKVVLCRVSAYCPCTRCTPGTGRTSTRTNAWRPGIAADPKWLAYGTVVEVEGYGTCPIDDTGGAMKKRNWTNNIPRLDVRMTYHWQARNFGVKYLYVKVYNS